MRKQQWREPGYYTAPFRRANWPPGFWQAKDSEREDRCSSESLRSAASAANAQKARESGKGWGNGTVTMPRTPKNIAPGWMKA